jgi:hypothetical protein
MDGWFQEQIEEIEFHEEIRRARERRAFFILHIAAHGGVVIAHILSKILAILFA